MYQILPTFQPERRTIARRLPPLIENVNPKSYIFNAAEKVILHCPASGIPKNTISWYRDGEDWEFLVGSNTTKSGNKMIIEQAFGVKHGGDYYCEAKNQYGTDRSSTVHLQQSVLDEIRSKSAEVIEVIEGYPFFFKPEHVRSIGKLSHRWKTVTEGQKNDNPTYLETGHRIALDQATGILYFAHATMDDQNKENREYKLESRNHILDVSKGSSPYILKVIKNNGTNNKVTRLVPKTALHNVTALLGENITLKCFFGGMPTPDITWNKPSRNLNNVDCTKQFNTECRIKEVQITNAGIYRCTGRNEHDEIFTDIHLKVEAFPDFEKRPQSVNITENRTATFQCIPKNGEPPVQMEWLSNGEKLNVSNLPPRMNISKDRTKLTVANVCKDCIGKPETDLQVFQCRIWNKYGETSASAYLNVLKRTVPKARAKTNYVLEITEAYFVADKFELPCAFEIDELMKDHVQITWQMNNKRITNGHPYLLQDNNMVLIINITEKDREFLDYMGKYTCVVKDSFSEIKIDFNLNTSSPVYRFQMAHVFTHFWWLVTIGMGLLILVLALTLGLRSMQGNEGGEYSVHNNEEREGINPYDEIEQEKFHEYKSLHFSRAASKLSIDTSVDV